MSSYYTPLTHDSSGLQNMTVGNPHSKGPIKREMTNSKKIGIAVGVSVFVGVIVIVGIILSPSSYAQRESGASSSTGTGPTSPPVNITTMSPTPSPMTPSPTEKGETRAPSSSPTTKSPTTKSPTTKSPTTKSPTASDPGPPRDDVTLVFHYAALGDWGVTDGSKHDSATHGDSGNLRNFNAQINVAAHLNAWAKNNNPSFVLSHGDNFYWTGVSKNSDHRFNTLFEQIYDEPSLYCPWYNVLGNHDIGGGSGFCGPSCWNCGAICEGTAEMEAALDLKFSSQSTYTSPNGNRWVLPSHYYVKTHHYPNERDSEFSIDIFNIETNAAGDRIANTCCQCYSGKTSPNCDNPGVGRPDCINGDVEQYRRCEAILNGWWDDSMSQLTRDLAESTATWKIVHNHYLLRHFTPAQQTEVKQILQEGGAQVFVGAHEHAEGHDLIDGIHYLENGGGGGAITKGGTGIVWHLQTYGFMIGKVNAKWMQIQFFDDNGANIHCYNIPQDRELSKKPDAATLYKC